MSYIPPRASGSTSDVAGVPVYVSARELKAWKHHDLTLDVEHGYADGLSLSPGSGLHFVTRSLPPQPRSTP